MRTGLADRRITIRSKSVTQDPDNGSDVVTWTDFLTRIPAEFEWMIPNRSEIVTRQVQLDKNQARVRIRWRAGVDSTMQVILHGIQDTTWQIVGGPAEIEGHRRRIELYLEAYTSSGAAP